MKLGLHNAPREVLWMCMSLPLLPQSCFEAGLAIMQTIADQVAPQHVRILEFMSYMRQQWLPRSHIVCAYRCPVRTNNEVEAVNRQLLGRFGHKPNVYRFIGRVVYNITRYVFSILNSNLLKYNIIFQ